MSSSTYEQIKSAATSFIAASSPVTPGTNEPNTATLRSTVSPAFTISWGHTYFISQRPPLQGEVSLDGFISHMDRMNPLLNTWKAEVTDVFVDVEKRTAVVRTSYHMTPKGRETVLNDIVWFIEVDGEGKVVKAKEFIDPAAAGKIQELLQLNREDAARK